MNFETIVYETAEEFLSDIKEEEYSTEEQLHFENYCRFIIDTLYNDPSVELTDTVRETKDMISGWRSTPKIKHLIKEFAVYLEDRLLINNFRINCLPKMM